MNAKTHNSLTTESSMTKLAASGRTMSALNLAILAAAFGLSATASKPASAGIFDAPTAKEIAAERDSCYRSKLCRALIDERPPAVMNAVNDEPLCAQNANRAAQALVAAGYPTKIVQVRLPEWRFASFSGSNRQTQRLHAFAATKIDGQWWAIDNGALAQCGRACKLNDALTGVEKIAENDAVVPNSIVPREENQVAQNEP